MFISRATLMGAAFVAAAPYVIKTAIAEETAATAGAEPVDLSSLTRRKVKLVAPPFEHEHDQVAFGAMAVSVFCASLILSWVGMPVLTPWRYPVGGAVLGLPAT